MLLLILHLCTCVHGACLQGLTQWRLGPLTVFDRNHPTMHYVLDMANPAHEQVRMESAWKAQVARGLNTAASQRTQTAQCLLSVVGFHVEARLRVLVPGQVARKLVDIANNFQDFPNMWNLRLNGMHCMLNCQANNCDSCMFAMARFIAGSLGSGLQLRNRVLQCHEPTLFNTHTSIALVR